MDKLFHKAISLGATDFGFSNTANKRFYVIYNNKKINFGSKYGRAYIDHHDEGKQNAWYARHSKIKNKHGEYVINLKTSPAYWSNLLWS